ncbi:glycosyltransferase family 4 protein [Synechococcus sp. CS-1325]|uniref:glycosyltransferase family 4 protein n=1 Tax=unclassified Synechococcus TaxID=2626047 RepID=UPI0021A270B6|nr:MULTISPECIES: glycosyltransferase family 4 protein [unclassified Synechococcus]MCT0200793.1 glycosyltransferase family 4 protein [Synechococcus sp. CS-1325]MCT0213832.1 glycosyltransferase family 4 protein [Synechococcus sp. CS-1326]MCT0233408.1 glycosyltransferase family 4 protein [Synechococcus sp. CS-1327]
MSAAKSWQRFEMKTHTLPLLIVETHPIQYRAPIYARLEQLRPGAVHVVYASDHSIRGARDPGFSANISWDTDLLAGYSFTILDSTLSHVPHGWNGLKGRGLPALINELNPKAILLNSFTYRYDHVAYAIARFRHISIWMRCETQDQAFPRSPLKSFLRSFYYRLFYTGVSMAFPIGSLNRRHWLRHGVSLHQLRDAHYCTPDRTALLSLRERNARRQSIRDQLGLHQDHILVAFFGKLIPKKDPALLLASIPYLPAEQRSQFALMYVGSGELQQDLQQQATSLHHRDGVSVHFPGFVNQKALVDWYLAADVVVLPSRQAGETWGLVVNEAMQAGCSVVVSEAVGCAADFCGWERFRTIPIGSAQHLAEALLDLAHYPRSFTWAATGLENYSIDSVAHAFAAAIDELS